MILCSFCSFYCFHCYLGQKVIMKKKRVFVGQYNLTGNKQLQGGNVANGKILDQNEHFYEIFTEDG